jgi:hypothetical protein
VTILRNVTVNDHKYKIPWQDLMIRDTNIPCWRLPDAQFGFVWLHTGGLHDKATHRLRPSYGGVTKPLRASLRHHQYTMGQLCATGRGFFTLSDKPLQFLAPPSYLNTTHVGYRETTCSIYPTRVQGLRTVNLGPVLALETFEVISRYLRRGRVTS